MPRARSFTSEQVAEAIREVVGEGLVPTTRAVHLKLGSGSRASFLTEYREQLERMIGDGCPLIGAAVSRLKDPLPSAPGGHKEADHVRTLAKDMNSAARSLDDLAASIETEGRDGRAYEKAKEVARKTARKLYRPFP